MPEVLIQKGLLSAPLLPQYLIGFYAMHPSHTTSPHAVTLSQPAVSLQRTESAWQRPVSSARLLVHPPFSAEFYNGFDQGLAMSTGRIY